MRIDSALLLVAITSIVFGVGVLLGLRATRLRRRFHEAERATALLAKMPTTDTQTVWEAQVLGHLKEIKGLVDPKDRRAQRTSRFLFSIMAILLGSFVAVLWLNAQLALRGPLTTAARVTPVPEPYFSPQVLYWAAAVVVIAPALLSLTRGRLGRGTTKARP